MIGMSARSELASPAVANKGGNVVNERLAP
jgi:hypothetical protein